MGKDNRERGGGVKLATKFTKIREVLNKQGEVIKSTVEKPDEPRKMRPIGKGMMERER